jgi:hypothetical protein
MFWLNITLAYLLVCWLLALILVRVVLQQSPEDERPGDGTPPLTGLLLLVFAPVFLPYVAGLTAAGVIKHLLYLRLLRRTLRKVREYEFNPVDIHEVDDSIRQHFETVAPALRELGFDQLGDFQLKPEPAEVHGRIFQGDDGEVLACARQVLDTSSVSFISVLEDGACIHTTSVPDPHPELTMLPEDRLCVSYRPETPIADLHSQHREIVWKLAGDNGTRVLCFPREQFAAVLVYDQCSFNRWRYRQGGLDQVPLQPDLESLRSVALRSRESGVSLAS